MIKNHLLSSDFDLSKTFKEKIREKTQQKDADLNLPVINDIIEKKNNIDYIQCSEEGANNVYLNGKRYALNQDELVMVIRESSHLYFDKEKQLFINLKLIRAIEKRNEDNVTLSYNKGNGVEFLNTKFKELEDFFHLLEKANVKDIGVDEFYYFKLKYFKIKTKKLIHESLFVNENKHLEESNRFSLIAILSSSLFYMIPFIPFVGVNELSLWIFPLTTILIGVLFLRRYNIKKQILDMF